MESKWVCEYVDLCSVDMKVMVLFVKTLFKKHTSIHLFGADFITLGKV